MITFYHRTVKEPELRELGGFQVGAWIDVEKPTDVELDRLSQEFNLERSLLGDAIDPYEVPRVEVEGKITYVFTRVPKNDGEETSTTPLLVALGPDFVLTITREHIPFLKAFRTGGKSFYTTQKIKLFLQLFFQIMHTYNSFLVGINKRVRAVSVNVERVQNREIMQFVRFESTVNDFLAALVPTNALLQNLLSGKYFRLYEEDEDLVEDLQLANVQLIELGKTTLTTIVNIRDAYSTIMTNNLNRVIKLLTALTIVFTIPTMIASFYGMNVPLPFSDSPSAFWLIIGFVALISVAILGLFARNRWL